MTLKSEIEKNGIAVKYGADGKTNLLYPRASGGAGAEGLKKQFLIDKSVMDSGFPDLMSKDEWVKSTDYTLSKRSELLQGVDDALAAYNTAQQGQKAASLETLKDKLAIRVKLSTQPLYF